MSGRLDQTPFAVTSDGTLFINVSTMTSETDFEAVVRAAHEMRGTAFIGVALSATETEFALARLDNAADEAAARIAGQRRRRPATRKTRTTRS